MWRASRPGYLALGVVGALPIPFLLIDNKLDADNIVETCTMSIDRLSNLIEHGTSEIINYTGHITRLKDFNQGTTMAAQHLHLAVAAGVQSSVPPSSSIPTLPHLSYFKFRRNITTVPDISALEVARLNPKDPIRIRTTAEKIYGKQLPPRFTDAELMRYACAFGYLQNPDAYQKTLIFQQAAESAAKTAEWLDTHTFATDESLAKYAHLLYWGSPDETGRPTLHIAIGRAVHDCRGPEALEFANCIITLVDKAVTDMQTDEEGRPQKINVVMDAAGVTALRASRLAWVFKAVAYSLNHQYPGRLHELLLADLPVMLTWLVAAVKKLVHPRTRDKIRVVRHGDLVE